MSLFDGKAQMVYSQMIVISLYQTFCLNHNFLLLAAYAEIHSTNRLRIKCERSHFFHRYQQIIIRHLQIRRKHKVRPAIKIPILGDYTTGHMICSTIFSIHIFSALSLPAGFSSFVFTSYFSLTQISSVPVLYLLSLTPSPSPHSPSA